MYIVCRASGSRYALGPYNTVDPPSLSLAEVTGRGYQREGLLTVNALRRDLGLASLVLGSRYCAHTGQFTRATPVLGSELASMSAIARTENERTEDERSESEVAAEIGHSQSTERAIARYRPFCDCDCP